MTALYMDGFDHYGDGAASITNMLAGPYATVSAQGACGAPPWGPARTGPACFFYSGSTFAGTPLARRVVPTPGTHFFVSLGFAVDSLAAGQNDLIAFMDGSAVTLVKLIWTSTGALALTLANGTVLGATAGPVIVPENWHFFEMEIDTSAHTFVLRVDDASGVETPILSVTNGSIAGTIAQFGLISGPVGASFQPRCYLDDLFVRDPSGSVNNGWLGDRRVATLLADADTETAGWTPRFYQKIGQGILNTTAANACVSAASNTSLNVGSGDFTIETFQRFKALPTASNKSVIFGKWDETANQRSYQLFLGSVALNGGALCFQTSTDGNSATVEQPIVYPFTPDLDRWYHIALVRASGELLLFVDGQQLGLPIADARTYFAGAAPLGVAGQVETAGAAIAGTELSGWFDETRFTVGFARYTTNFTPTTTPFPRGAIDDPEWADVALLCGYESAIQDESSFSRALTARNSAAQQTVFDGPLVGTWSTIGKAVPDDNTFVEAPFLQASDILTLSAQPAANDTVTVGTTDGTTAAVYKFVSPVSAAFDVLIDTSLQQTLQNLFNAVNAGAGAGTKYGTGTTANADVAAEQLPAGQMGVLANTAGSDGNSIAATTSLIHGGGWATPTLDGGADIPGPSDFKVQRPPPLTTIISAVQVTQRAFKSDAGLCSVESGLVGPLGNVTSSGNHSLTVSPSYYGDIFEEDPDTSASITPATLINGRIRLTRTV